MSAPGSAERIERLAAIPMFVHLDSAALARILEKMDEFEAAPGQVLVQPGREGSGMFVIEEGTVEVTRKGANIELGPGEFVGELALLVPDASRTARVKAKSTVTGLAIGRAEFVELLEDEPRIAVGMLEALAKRLSDLIH